MLSFPKKTLDLLKKYLLREKAEVDKSLKEIEEDDPANTPVLAESSEPGTDSYIADIHTKTLVLGQRLKDTKNSIITALSKIKKGTYGKCDNCGKPIEVGRLLAMPMAQYCLSCSQKISKKR